MATTTERRDVERIFNGEQLADGHVLTGVAQFLDAVGGIYGARPAPAPRSDLAAVMNAGGAPAGTGVEPGVRSAMKPAFRSGTGPVRSRPRRSRTVAALAAALVLSIAATGGLAAASALPDPVQRAVADFADQFGVHLPQPDLPVAGTASGSADARVSTESSSVPDTSAPTTTAGSATTTPPSSVPPPSTTTTSVAGVSPTTIVGALPSTALPSTAVPALPTIPNVPKAAGVDSLLPECRGSWLLQAAHLCRETGH